MAIRSKAKSYVVCLDNADYRTSLVVRRIYQSVPDSDADKHGLIRVIDESGEDYLFPKELFAEIELPQGLKRKLAAAT
jgi:hypothetical protein